METSPYPDKNGFNISVKIKNFELCLKCLASRTYTGRSVSRDPVSDIISYSVLVSDSVSDSRFRLLSLIRQNKFFSRKTGRKPTYKNLLFSSLKFCPVFVWVVRF